MRSVCAVEHGQSKMDRKEKIRWIARSVEYGAANIGISGPRGIITVLRNKLPMG